MTRLSRSGRSFPTAFWPIRCGDVPDALHFHVHACRVASPGRQHALLVDLRRQRGRPFRAHRLHSSSTCSAGSRPPSAQTAFSLDSNVPNLGASGRLRECWAATYCCSHRKGSRVLQGQQSDSGARADGHWAVVRICRPFSGIGATGQRSERGEAWRIWRTSAAFWLDSC